jgi:hypothetical protein
MKKFGHDNGNWSKTKDLLYEKRQFLNFKTGIPCHKTPHLKMGLVKLKNRISVRLWQI